MSNARVSSTAADATGTLPARQQAAALCWRLDDGVVQTLLISTRGTGRWIIPKGWLIDGLSRAESAAREAWEEAGVTGYCSVHSIGAFSFAKRRKRVGSVMCRADVFPLRVTGVADQYQEAGQRRRKWFTLDQAADRVLDSDLSALLRGFTLTQH